MSSKTLILVPTYNEIENITKFLHSLIEIPGFDVLIIDDNSPDGTANAVKKVQKNSDRVHLLNRAKKEGLALAYLAGFQWGFDRAYETFIQMDADFSHAPKDVPRLIEALKTHDMAMGSRYVPGGSTSGWTAIRKCISRGGNIYAQSVLGAPYKDMTGGFNAWKKHVLDKIDLSKIRSRGYAYQVEMKYRCHRAGFKMAEVPILFENRVLGVSKMSGKIVWEAAARVLKLKILPVFV